MNMRVLFAIHGPADARTAVYRTVRRCRRAAASRPRGRSAGGRRPAWASPRLDPCFLPPALARRRLARYDAVVFHSHLGWAFHARARRSTRGACATVTSFHGLEPMYFRALARRSRPRGAAAVGALPAGARHDDAAPLAFQLPRVGRGLLPELHRGALSGRDGWAAADRIEDRAQRRGAGVLHGSPRAPAGARAAVRRAVAAGQGDRRSREAFTALAAQPICELACVGTGAPRDAVLAAFPEHVRGRVRVRPRVDRAGLYAELARPISSCSRRSRRGSARPCSKPWRPACRHRRHAGRCGRGSAARRRQRAVVPPADAAAAAAAVRRYLEDGGRRAARRGRRATAERYRQETVCRIMGGERGGTSWSGGPKTGGT